MSRLILVYVIEQPASYEWPDAQFLHWLSRWLGTSPPAEWALVFVSVAGVIAALWTLISINRQAIASERAASIAAQSLAITQRGYVHIGGWRDVSLSDKNTMVHFVLSNRGRTGITIERGVMAFSGQHQDTGESILDLSQATNWTYPFDFKPQTLGPNEKTPPGTPRWAVYPAIKDEALLQWDDHQAISLFLTGDIWCRDAFPDTPLHHKRFGVRYDNNDRKWVANEFVPNDETDE